MSSTTSQTRKTKNAGIIVRTYVPNFYVSCRAILVSVYTYFLNVNPACGARGAEPPTQSCRAALRGRVVCVRHNLHHRVRIGVEEQYKTSCRHPPPSTCYRSNERSPTPYASWNARSNWNAGRVLPSARYLRAQVRTGQRDDERCRARIRDVLGGTRPNPHRFLSKPTIVLSQES